MSNPLPAAHLVSCSSVRGHGSVPAKSSAKQTLNLTDCIVSNSNTSLHSCSVSVSDFNFSERSSSQTDAINITMPSRSSITISLLQKTNKLQEHSHMNAKFMRVYELIKVQARYKRLNMKRLVKCTHLACIK